MYHNVLKSRLLLPSSGKTGGDFIWYFASSYNPSLDLERLALLEEVKEICPYFQSEDESRNSLNM
jgi:hypothetical protein